jgi:dTDP-4-amino-4,6-dideoxygalactose transaminase
MTAGEGGIITTNNTDYAETCESLVWAGRERGQPWYYHVVLASNARMTEFQGAILLAQLTRLQGQTEKRMTNAHLLDGLLNEIEGIDPLVLLPTTSSHSYHIYLFRYHPEAFGELDKHQFVKALQAEGIKGAFAGYTMFIEKRFFGGPWPVDAWRHGRELDYAAFAYRCPVSERACASEAVWIPQTMLLADEEAMHDIVKAIKKIQTHVGELL